MGLVMNLAGVLLIVETTWHVSGWNLAWSSFIAPEALRTVCVFSFNLAGIQPDEEDATHSFGNRGSRDHGGC